jgi:hypothetical protein
LFQQSEIREQTDNIQICARWSNDDSEKKIMKINLDDFAVFSKLICRVFFMTLAGNFFLFDGQKQLILCMIQIKR